MVLENIPDLNRPHYKQLKTYLEQYFHRSYYDIADTGGAATCEARALGSHSKPFSYKIHPFSADCNLSRSFHLLNNTQGLFSITFCVFLFTIVHAHPESLFSDYRLSALISDSVPLTPRIILTKAFSSCSLWLQTMRDRMFDTSLPSTPRASYP